MNLTPRERIVLKDLSVVLRLEGENVDALQIYVFLKVRGDRLEACLQALDGPGFDPPAWGEVLGSGHGRPTAFLQRRILEQAGVEPG